MLTRPAAALLLVLLAGCGGDPTTGDGPSTSPSGAAEAAETPTETKDPQPSATAETPSARGTRIVVEDSEFGDHPLYFYAHEGRREVKCHDVFLNGGNWYVVRPGGDAAPPG